MLKINTRKRAQLCHVPFLLGIIFLIVIYFFLFHASLFHLPLSKYRKVLTGLIIIVVGTGIWRVYVSTYLDIELFPGHLVVREYSLFKKAPAKTVNYLEIPSKNLAGYYWDERKRLLCFTIRSPNKERTTIRFSSDYLSWHEKKAIVHYLQNLLLDKPYNDHQS
ncbi:hypothetical protein [Chryseobacterium gossypii]|uniref:hypothetical protein n=1 Tax=Chryseobacterium gossypii TaxID=3231602 RepID=UPI0035243A9C